jgi:hypothetical protein
MFTEINLRVAVYRYCLTKGQAGLLRTKRDGLVGSAEGFVHHYLLD